MFYNFLNRDYALKAICNKRLKVARISELNDPYELNALASTNADLIAAVDRAKAQLDGTRGLLCFSRDWCDPVIWSHYADRHRGICLGFVRNGEDPAPVVYSSTLLPEEWLLGLLNLPSGPEKEAEVMKWLTHKYVAWEYEHESRVFISLNEPDAIEPNLYFADFGPDGIDLREVIIGVRCETTVAEIEAILADHGYTEVKVIKARLSPTSYEVTESR
jgi:hypothetical protein